MSKCKRIVKVILVITALMLCITTNVKAAELSTETPIRTASAVDEIINAGKEFINKGEQQQTSETSVSAFANRLAPIGSILAAVGTVIFLAVLAVMGIKWVTAKPDQKAKLQQQFVGYVIAAVVFFGAVGIWTLVTNLMSSIEAGIN